jgi:hypothetical protein
MKEIETFILFNFGPNYKQIDLSQIMLKFKLVLELNTVQKRESFVLENKIKVTSGLQDDRNTMKLEINGQEIYLSAHESERTTFNKWLS